MMLSNLHDPHAERGLRPIWPQSVRLQAFHLAFAMLVGCSTIWANDANPPASKTQPSPEQLKAFVLGYYRSLPGYQPGDVISRSSTQKLFQQLQQKGMTMQDPESILERVLPDDDILVTQLQTKKGRAFWKKIGQLPGGIDRVDRLARMPQGQANVRDLIQKIPDGYKWIEGMATTQRGRRMGDRLSQSPSGRNFNRPTKRIYTAEELVEVLVGELPAVTPRGKKTKFGPDMAERDFDRNG